MITVDYCNETECVCFLQWHLKLCKPFCLFLCKYDLKGNPIFIQVPELDKRNLIKQIKQNITLILLFTKENGPISNLCVAKIWKPLGLLAHLKAIRESGVPI